MKIHIIGCSGSGKTYLANALSKKYNISHFDLDDIQWDNNAKEYGKKRTLDERNALLQEIIYVFLTIFLYLPKCPQSLILSALRAFCFCGKPHISRSIFLYFRYQAWLKSW